MLQRLYGTIQKIYYKYRYKFLARNVKKIELHYQEVKSGGYYSQYGQDKWIVEKFFSGKENGTFVDIGAHDGVTFSNTYFLEKAGWKGVAVEPIKEVYENLIKNRQCITVNGCISAKTGKESFRVISGHAEMLSGLVSEFDPKHLKRIEKDVRSYGGEIKDIEVNSYNFNDLLAGFEISQVDYINIDTEGAEYKILNTIDFNRICISVLSVENTDSDYRIPELMIQKGFQLCARIGSDDIYRNQKTASV